GVTRRSPPARAAPVPPSRSGSPCHLLLLQGLTSPFPVPRATGPSWSNRRREPPAPARLPDAAAGVDDARPASGPAVLPAQRSIPPRPHRPTGKDEAVAPLPAPGPCPLQLQAQHLVSQPEHGGIVQPGDGRPPREE